MSEDGIKRARCQVCGSHAISIELEPKPPVEAAAPELLEALTELLAAELAQFPPASAGREAQDAWADRRATARNNAQAAITKATSAKRSDANV